MKLYAKIRIKAFGSPCGLGEREDIKHTHKMPEGNS